MKKYILKIVPLFLILFTQTVNAQVQLTIAQGKPTHCFEWHGAVYAYLTYGN